MTEIVSAESSESESESEQSEKIENEKSPINASDAEKLARKYKVKIDGSESEVDEDELVRSYQLRKVSDKRLQEATQARKQAEEFVHLLKSDPIRLLSDPRIGHDVKKLAEDFLMKEIEDSQLSPDQKELREIKAKLKSYEDWKKEQETSAMAEQEQKLVAHHREKYQTDIINALQKSGLPNTHSTVQRMIHYMSQSLEHEHGYGLEAEDVVDLVKNDYIKDTKSIYSNVPDDVLLSVLGDDIVKKVIKADLAKMKKNPVAMQKSYSGPILDQKKSEKISIDAWKERLEKIKNGED